MAIKCEWEGKPAYKEGSIILQLNENSRWDIFHEKSKWKMMGVGIDNVLKQKKEALKYAVALIERFNMEFETLEQMLELNGGIENCVRLRNESYYKSQEE